MCSRMLRVPYIRRGAAGDNEGAMWATWLWQLRVSWPQVTHSLTGMQSTTPPPPDEAKINMWYSYSQLVAWVFTRCNNRMAALCKMTHGQLKQLEG